MGRLRRSRQLPCTGGRRTAASQVVSSQLSVVSRCAGGEEAGAFAARGREREGRGYRAAWELV